MSTLVETLREKRSEMITKATEIAQTSVTEGRDLTVEEQTAFDQMIADAELIGERAANLIAAEQRSKDIEASFVAPSDMGRRAPEGSPLGDWARSAQVGAAGFDLRATTPGLENRAIAAFRRGEQRAMGTGGTSADAVYSSLWEYAVETSQILQSGVQIITTQGGNALPMPAVTAHAVGSSAAANAPITASDAVLTTVSLSVTKNGYLTLVPYELTQDATFDLDGYLSRAAGRELGNQISKIAAAALIFGLALTFSVIFFAVVVAAGRFAHGSGQMQVVRLVCRWGLEPLAITVHATRGQVRKLRSVAEMTTWPSPTSKVAMSALPRRPSTPAA